MKVPVSWLKEYVEINLRPEDLADRLTHGGLEVGAVEFHGRNIEGIVVGKIKSVEKLTVGEYVHCQIDIGLKMIPIITDDVTLKVGEKVPIALEGSSLANNMKIKKQVLHGIETFGYLCKSHELGFQPEEKIMRLPLDAKVGEDVRKFIGKGGHVLDVDVLPNRSDCLSVVGIAREVSAILKKPLKIPKIVVKEDKKAIDFKVKVEDPSHCPRYMARVIKGVKIGESPDWLKDKLLLSGIRPINNIVDVTNYVLLEMGQPLHAFDRAKIVDKLVVRLAKKGEKIVTLDGKERKLKEDILVIADQNKPQALAGIMGGEKSEIGLDTNEIVLESAYFEPALINKSSKYLKLRTESSIRFERGVDWEGVENALDRCAELISRLSGGSVLKGKIDIKQKKWVPKILSLNSDKVGKLLGIKISSATIKTLLRRLGFKVTQGKSRTILKVVVPLFRKGDIEREVDLIEEVARLYGYENIPEERPTIYQKQVAGDRWQKLTRKISEVLTGLGLYEVQTFSLISPKIEEIFKKYDVDDCIKTSNPLTEDESVLRNLLFPSLLKVIQHNVYHQIGKMAIFEIGKVFKKGKGPLPEEKYILGGGIFHPKLSYYDLKGIIEALFYSLGIEDTTLVSGHKFLHPGQSATILDKNDKILGYFGLLHPDLQTEFEIRHRTGIFEIDMQLLEKRAFPIKKYKVFSRFPKVDRDVSMVIPQGVSYKSIFEIIQKAGGELLESIKLFDIYKGSFAFRLSYRHKNKTLSDEEVNDIHKKVQQALTSELKITLR